MVATVKMMTATTTTTTTTRERERIATIVVIGAAISLNEEEEEEEGGDDDDNVVTGTFVTISVNQCSERLPEAIWPGWNREHLYYLHNGNVPTCSLSLIRLKLIRFKKQKKL